MAFFLLVKIKSSTSLDIINAQLTIFLFLEDPDAVDCTGNVLLDRFVGAKIILVPPLNYEGSVVDGVRQKGLKHKMLEYTEKLK